MVMASLADDSEVDHAAGMYRYSEFSQFYFCSAALKDSTDILLFMFADALVVSDTLEVQWVEGKDGEMRRISRLDRTTRRPVSSP